MEFKFIIILTGMLVSLSFGVGLHCWKLSFTEPGFRSVGYMFLGSIFHGVCFYMLADLFKLIGFAYSMQILKILKAVSQAG